jgi:hypothetical protein
MALRRFAVAVSMALAALLAMPGVVRGQGPAEPLARSLTADQLDAFVELTGDAKPLVWQRLLADPGLVRYAAAAADARLERRASGKTMTIVGFTVLGVGAAAGYGLFLWGLSQGICDYGTSCHANESMMLSGVLLALASIAVGCSVGIPGIIRMVRPSEAENEASGRYQTPGLPPMPGYPTPYPHSLRLRPAGTLVSAPILTLTF